MTYMEKIKEAQKRKIDIPTELADGRSRVGIYKFFKIKDNDIYCFYVGKSTDIAYRLLGSSDGHIYMYLNTNLKKLVPIKIAEYIKNGYAIRVEITEVNYEDTSFSKAAHRLALAELQEIGNKFGFITLSKFLFRVNKMQKYVITPVLKAVVLKCQCTTAQHNFRCSPR